MFDRLEQFGLNDLKDELINVIDSAIYDGAQNYAREQIINLWVEMEEEITRLQEPPTEEQLSLEHPEMFM
tara:strand:- start:593 stop:802 length:210 start_codon:yes stop_codon:yes gene_type:complete